MTKEQEKPWEPKIPMVPEHWCQIDFEQAFSSVSVNGFRVPATAYLESGTLPVVDQGQSFIGGFTNDLSKTIDPGEGVVIFGDHTRAFKKVDFPFAAGADGIKVLRPLVSNAAFAYYACLSLQFPNKGYSRHYSFLNRCKFPVPPEGEQNRIVSKIDELFSEIEEGERALKKVRTLVERYRQSVLKAAVTGELTRDWREKHKDKLESGEALLARILKARREAWETAELTRMKAKGQKPVGVAWKARYKEPLQPDISALPPLPSGWIWASLDQLTSKITSGSRDWKSFYGRGSGVFVMAQNVRKGRLDWREIQRVDPPPGERDAERSRVCQHDLLITIVGANTGDVCRVPEPLLNHFVCQSVALLRPVDRTSARFLESFLAAEEGGQRQFEDIIYGAGRPHLDFDSLRAVCIPLCGRLERAGIEDAIAKVDSDVLVVEETLRRSELQSKALRQGTLRSAFTGKLVPQDPSDEPASVLLERIAAERAATSSKKKKPAAKPQRKTRKAKA